MSLVRGFIQMQVVFAFSAFIFLVDAAPTALEHFGDIVDESDNFGFQDIDSYDSSLESTERSFQSRGEFQEMPSLYLDRRAKKLYLTHVDKPLIRKIEELLEEEIRHRNKRDEVKQKKYISDAAPCFFKICNLGKRRVRPTEK